MEGTGLVLASIPILVSALEHYVEGIGTIRRWRQYKRELESIIRRIQAESTILQNTCEKLLENLTTPDELEALIAEPGGSSWKNHNLNKSLQMFLGSSYTSYIDSVEDLVKAKRELEIELGLDSNGKAPGCDNHTFKYQFGKIKFGLKSRHYENALNKIERYNSTLIHLTDQNKELAPGRKRRCRAVQQFKVVQAHAENLYHSIKGGWNCNCAAPHDANLRLATRLSDENTPRPHLQDVSSQNGVLFNVLFPVKKSSNSSAAQWSWQETKIGLLDQQSDSLYKSKESGARQSSSYSSQISSKPTGLCAGSSSSTPVSAQNKRGSPSSTETKFSKSSKKRVKFANDEAALELDEICALTSKQEISDLVQIKNICITLQQCIGNMLHSQNCLGYLLDHGQKPLGVYLSQPSQAACDEFKVTSLAEILSKAHSTPGQNLMGSGKILYRGDRLIIALTIASSVLQLYKTPWLRENWNKNDIKISESAKDAYHEQTYISGSFPGTVCQTFTQENSLAHLARNESLFALGILLIELCFGRPLETMRDDRDPLGANSVPDIMTDWSTAKRMMEAVDNEAGMRYGDVVRRCIYCEFDKRSTTLEDDGFRQAVYDGVVAPLEDDIRFFFPAAP